jgi:hypothetical protein
MQNAMTCAYRCGHYNFKKTIALLVLECRPRLPPRKPTRDRDIDRDMDKDRDRDIVKDRDRDKVTSSAAHAGALPDRLILTTCTHTHNTSY